MISGCSALERDHGVRALKFACAVPDASTAVQFLRDARRSPITDDGGETNCAQGNTVMRFISVAGRENERWGSERLRGALEGDLTPRLGMTTHASAATRLVNMNFTVFVSRLAFSSPLLERHHHLLIGLSQGLDAARCGYGSFS